MVLNAALRSSLVVDHGELVGIHDDLQPFGPSSFGRHRRVLQRPGYILPHVNGIPHTRPPSSSLCQYAAIMSAIEISAVIVNSSPIAMAPLRTSFLAGKIRKAEESFKRKNFFAAQKKLRAM
jgi:hypothetical protein